MKKKIRDLLVCFKGSARKELNILVKRKPPNFREKKPKRDFVCPRIRKEWSSIFFMVFAGVASFGWLALLTFYY